MNYKIWDKQELLITPTGKVFTPEQIFEQYPAAQVDGIDYIITDSKINMGVFMQYDETIDVYANMGVEFTEEMSVQEKLNAIRAFETKKQEPTPTAEERIAAAMEFQNMLAMAEEVIV